MPRVRRRGFERRKVDWSYIPIYDKDILQNGFVRGRPGVLVRNDDDVIAIYWANAVHLAGSYAERIAKERLACHE